MAVRPGCQLCGSGPGGAVVCGRGYSVSVHTGPPPGVPDDSDHLAGTCQKPLKSGHYFWKWHQQNLEILLMPFSPGNGLRVIVGVCHNPFHILKETSKI